MDEVHLTSQEVRDIVLLLLDAIDIAEGTKRVPVTWTYRAWVQASYLLECLYGEEDFQ